MSKLVKSSIEVAANVAAFGYREYANLKDIVIENVIDEDIKVDVKDQKERLFDEIFGVDPRTKLPNSDVALFLSDNTAPEIKDFIVNQLLSDNHLSDDGARYDGLDDDVIAQYTRSSDESIDSYRNRIFGDLVKNYQADKSNQND